MPETATVETPAVESAPQSEAPFAWLDNFGLDEAETVETPLPDAATSAAVETPKQAEAADVPAKVEPAPATPPGTEEKPAAASTETPAEAAAPVVEAEPEVKDDPELTAEDNELVRTRPEAERPALTGRLKKASFMSQYLDPEVPATGTVEALRKISPSSFARLEGEILSRKLSDAATFADEIFRSDAKQNDEGRWVSENYGNLALEVYKSDPNYFIKQITGRDGLSAEEVRTAVEFYEHNKDRIPRESAIGELSPEVLADAKLYLGDEAAAQIEAAFRAAKEATEKRAPITTPQPEQPKAESAKDPAKPEQQPAAKELTPEQQRAQQAQTNQIWDEASAPIDNYLETWADDPKNGLGLKVTDQERQLAPEVADLKVYKRKVLFEGIDDLPSFATGFYTWGKDRPEVVKLVTRGLYFAERGEKENATEVARELLPLVDKYKQERMQAPIFARLDAQIAAATARTNPKTENDAIIPGAVGNRSPQPTSDPNKRIDDLLLNDAMNA